MRHLLLLLASCGTSLSENPTLHETIVDCDEEAVEVDLGTDSALYLVEECSTDDLCRPFDSETHIGRRDSVLTILCDQPGWYLVVRWVE